MPRKKDSEAHLRQAKERGAKEDTGIVNDKPVQKELEDATKRHHNRQVVFWYQFVRENPNASVNNLKSLKDFIKHVALGIDGMKAHDDGDDTDDEDSHVAAGLETVRNYWNNFTGVWKRIHPPDVMMVIFLNEDERPKFAIQFIKDAKNMTNTPHKRPKHVFYEGRYPDPLYQNPFLPYLVMFLARRPFQDYETLEKLFTITPTMEQRAFQIHWKKERLDMPFFLGQSTKVRGKIESAGAFSTRHRDLGRRAGFPNPPTIHDWRAEGLYLTDKSYSQDQRMGQAAHHDPNTFRDNYQPKNSGVDGQATFLGTESRDMMNDVFRELILPRNPNLWHCLPAEKQHDIENSEKFLELEDKMAVMRLKTDADLDHHHEINTLHKKKSKFLEKELRKYQRKQPYRPGDPPGYHREIFNRCRFMMPERDRLAVNLFEVASLRSPVGLAVIRDMLTLYERGRKIKFRPGLEPDKYCCFGKDERSTLNLEKRPDPYDWKHIYNCYKTRHTKIYGYAELCFLCNQWFFGKEVWEVHCESHVNDLNTFPVYLDPLVYDGVLAVPGFCYWCLMDPDLPARKRMYQFKNRSKWLTHIKIHIKGLDQSKPMTCYRRMPQCTNSFDTALKFLFHLQDAHGLPLSKKRKRPREESEEFQPVRGKRQRQGYEKDEPEIKEELMKFSFITTTPEMIRDRASVKPAASSGYSTPSLILENTTERENNDCGVQTPPSVVYDEIPIDPAILYPATSVPDLDLTEVVDLTGVHDTHDPKCPTMITIQDDFVRAPMNDIIPARAYIQGEDAGFATLLDTEITFGPNPSDDEVLHSNPNHQRGSSEPTEDLKSMNGPNTSCDDRPPPVNPKNDRWEVERLCGKRPRGRTYEYYVKWLGYPENENTWEKKKDIDAEAVAAYEASLLLSQDQR